ncbi:Methyltransferase domain-containing protein [Leifsonia sp. 98AMF]|uniref:class I SAM-dependent methyltransferase n=1 Tax=unclassified Leifsonia TaxID=2663824 RepID=UPI00087A29E6|nr:MULTISPECIES: methyltransferase domain-containing protein [unclassified Leifsonia]SDH33888.1 Methyltransferase domain-containing protein [Leifsonia sp. 197AMF]SDJ01331.1 Methyltransferase domain-containing protein [Leifsonia sp. 466MF]SDJ72396.1 Methyltransferase domain-containing protein [Leifsonia sp. 157MF]SDO04976.1 Methyltransferase domain-containing protein [Leifsonia sp. 509MF]SEM99196.1 Methyltransferase domain-containing protein [Leifsonia sp. 467MF]
MPDPMHFDRHADLYDRARPPYPAALWERLAELGLLVAGARALDLGAGSGQATRGLVEAGMEVTAVEPGAALAARLAERFPDVRVIAATAEEADLPTASFTLATIATAVHWFDLGVVLPKLHSALVPGAHLTVWRNAYGDAAVAPTPFRERVQAIVDRRDAPPRPGPDESQTAKWARLLESGGYFRASHVAEIAWAIDLDEDGVRGLFTTFSDWSEAEAEEAARAVRNLGGTVTEHYRTPLILLDRVG